MSRQPRGRSSRAATALFSTTTRVGTVSILNRSSRSGRSSSRDPHDVERAVVAPPLQHLREEALDPPAVPDRVEWKKTSLGCSASGGIATVMSHLRWIWKGEDLALARNESISARTCSFVTSGRGAVSKLRAMRRVAVTGSARSRRSGTMRRRPGARPWRARAASTGSGRSTRAGAVRIAAEVKDFDADAGRLGQGGAKARAERAARACGAAARRSGDAGLNGFDPMRVGIVFGTAIGGVSGILEQDGDPPRARARPRLAELPAERPGRLRQRAARDLARHQGPELRRRLRVRDRLARDRRGRGADQARRRRRDARGRRRGLPAPPDPRRLHGDARAGGRGRGSAARLAPVRRHARRVRHGRGRVRLRPGGARGRAGARRPRSTPRCSATARRTTRTTWRSPSRRRPASPT